MATNKPQTDFQKQGVRIPRDLHERIHAAALESGRSYNSELIHIIQTHFDGQPRVEPPPPRDYFEDLRGAAVARRSIDAINTQILMLESDATRMHKDILELQLRKPTDKIAVGGESVGQYIERLKRLAAEADAQASALRAHVAKLPGADLPHAASSLHRRTLK